jgi:rare lipoprotein A
MRIGPGTISKVCSVLISCVALAAVTAPVANAERRKAAPIVYGNEGAAPGPVSLAAGGKSQEKSKSRIEFRYPDQPETYFGSGGTKSAAGAGPVAFVSAESALTTSQAREISKTPAPAIENTSAGRDPALSPGAFDARAAATKTARAPGPVAERALEPLPVRARETVKFQPAAGAELALAVIYGDEFDGLATSNGETFDQTRLTAAHPTLPLPSLVEVMNPATGANVTLRVNDRGPFEDGASFQVSRQAARVLGFERAGQAELTLRVIEAGDPKPVAARSQPKSLLTPATVAVMTRSELLGGDELAGGSAPAAKTRATVQWPEPPADWGVRAQGPKPSVATPGTHFVQLASFSDIGNAEAMFRGLQSDLPVEIVPARVNGADYFRVRVGPLDSRASAQELRDRLDAEGKGDGRVVTAE